MHHELRRGPTANGRAFHVRRNASGTWQKTEIPVPLNSSQRTKLILDKYDNAYAIFPFGRIAGASAASGYTDWKILFDGSGLNAFGEVVIDETRVGAGRGAVLHVPGEVERYDALGAARRRLRLPA